MAAKYVLSPSGDQYRFVLKAGNGETILSSERYTTKAAALNGIESVRKNSPLEERYSLKVAKNGQPMFNLLAGNHQIIGTSEMYSSEASRKTGIESVKKNGPVAELDDKT